MLRWLSVVLFLSCAHADPLITSGETLAALGDSYVATSAAMESALTAHTVTPAQYATWSTFASKFQAAYPPAVRLWDVAERSRDATMRAQVTALVSQLAADLGAYAAAASGRVDGGA